MDYLRNKILKQAFLMKRLILLLAIIFPISAYSSEIRGLHISATGNNKFECEIKANIDGMRRALTLVANSIGITEANFKEVPYLELKEVFRVKDKISEKSFDERYTADVTYAYDNLDANQLILKYGSKEVKDQFFKYVVIPVFKQRNVLSFLDKRTEWLSTWMGSTEDASRYKLLPVDPTKSAKDITTANLYDLSYEDFLDKLNMKRFEKVLITSCEYFTRKNGTMYIEVKNTELSSEGTNVTETRYDIGNPNQARKYFGVAIDRIITTFGKRAKVEMLPNVSDISYASERLKLSRAKAKKAGSVLDDLLRRPGTDKRLNKVFMRADIFSQEGLKSFKDKLDKVDEVVKYKIDLDEYNHYILTIYTDADMAGLAEGFYINQLSFRSYDEEYITFELQGGV